MIRPTLAVHVAGGVGPARVGRPTWSRAQASPRRDRAAPCLRGALGSINPGCPPAGGSDFAGPTWVTSRAGGPTPPPVPSPPGGMPPAGDGRHRAAVEDTWNTSGQSGSSSGDVGAVDVGQCGGGRGRWRARGRGGACASRPWRWRCSSSAERGHHADDSKPHGLMRRKYGEVGGDVEREAVERDPAPARDADRADLLAPAGSRRRATRRSCRARGPRRARSAAQVRITASSRLRRKRCRSRSPSPSSTIGYATSWPGPW